MEQARITSPQGPQTAHASRNKPAAQGKDSLADASGGAAPGGFMALLAALGDGSTQDPLAPQGAAESTLTTEPASSDVVAQAVSQGGLLSWQWATAMAQGSAEQGVTGNGVPGAPVAVLGGGLGLAPDALPSLIPTDGPLQEGSLLLQTALQDAAVAGDERGMTADIQGVLSSAGRRKLPGRIGGGSAQAGDPASTPGAPSLGVVGAKGQGAPTVQGAIAQPLGTERRDTGGARDGIRPLELGVDGVPAALASFVSEATGGRVLARGAESGASVAGGGGSAEVSHESPMGLGGETGAAVVDPAMVGGEDAVAEQVAYWVHQNIQNARMTVKHDGQPVEVSVSLSGNEAHVAFGSDEVQTRELLDGGVSQLRDMLRQEGLELSGVTVGESGRRSGDEDAGSGSPKQAPRQAQVVVPAVEVQAAGRARVPGDRAVDIFV